MHLKANLIKLLKSIGVDTRQAIVGIIVGSLIVAGGGLLYLSKTALNFSILLLSTPTPLWATILLILLCGLYIHLKVQQNLQKGPPLDPPPKTLLIEVNQFKWKTDVYQSGEFKIHSIPYCLTHETRFIEYSAVYTCPAIQLGCKSIIKKSDLKLQRDIAHSFIEHKLKEK